MESVDISLTDLILVDRTPFAVEMVFERPLNVDRAVVGFFESQRAPGIKVTQHLRRLNARD
uniref:Uncharacterized protein n=1 Tax=Candidatus Kentrum eta TaxID=2126337 RepID=A0A450VGH9_9GAMM|nr:MAG: hypothetical protein BECKH772B_GA0070898_103881 [Candidatus Kentron sp. H]VFK07707.1 MAG: hypothetical protein BECKH772C_GA0070978_104481 [Candidatus Kentron sp. H]